jgi:hypothetical protein
MRHEVHLTKAAFRLALPAAAIFIVAGVIVGSWAGAASAALGAGLVIANLVLAAGSTAWSRTITSGMLAAGFFGFFFRMFAVVAAFALLATRDWVNPPVLAAAFCGVLVAALAGACIGYARGSYVPNWRLK